jgi:ketosteroid isomerase-like protein
MGARAQVVQSAYDAFGRGDIPAILGMLDEGVAWTSPRTLPQGGTYKGPGEVGSFFEKVGSAWERLDARPESIGEVGDDLVVALVRLAGTRRGGEAQGYGAVHVFTVRDGRIAGFSEYTDLDEPLG